jgi:hypothetical protein
MKNKLTSAIKAYEATSTTAPYNEVFQLKRSIVDALTAYNVSVPQKERVMVTPTHRCNDAGDMMRLFCLTGFTTLGRIDDDHRAFLNLEPRS